MMPHPTTMDFAWEEEVLRSSGVLVVVFVLAVVALIGSLFLLGSSGFSADPNQFVASSPEHARVAVVR